MLEQKLGQVFLLWVKLVFVFFFFFMYGVLNCLPCELILWYIFPLSKMPLSPHPTRESLAGSEILARQLFILAL